jgi:hypothetical protein
MVDPGVFCKGAPASFFINGISVKQDGAPVAGYTWSAASGASYPFTVTTDTPEPSTWILIVLAAAVITLWRRSASRRIG